MLALKLADMLEWSFSIITYETRGNVATHFFASKGVKIYWPKLCLGLYVCMRITATPRVHYGLFKLRHESATKRTPPAGYFTRSYGRVFSPHPRIKDMVLLQHVPSFGCHVMAVVLPCVMSFLAAWIACWTIASSVCSWTTPVLSHQNLAQDSSQLSSSFITEILQQKSSSPGTSHLQPFRLIRVSKTETHMCSPTNKQKSHGYQGSSCPMWSK